MQNEKATPSKRKQHARKVGKFALTYIAIPMLHGAAVAIGGFAIHKLTTGAPKEENLALVTPIRKAMNS